MNRRKFLQTLALNELLYNQLRAEIIDKIPTKHLERAKFLEQTLEDITNKNFQQSEYINPEWKLFTLSFSTYALTNLAFTDSSFKERNTEYIDLAIQKAIESEIQQDYSFKRFPIKEQESVIYLGHLNLMLGVYKLLTNNTKYDEIHSNITNHLSKSIQQSKYKNIESYPGLIWPADNTVALASLKIYDKTFQTEYSQVCNEWVNWISENLLDKKTGLMQSQINPITGKSLQKPRGCSLAWSIIFESIFNKEFAKEQYEKFKKEYFTDIGIFTIVKEYKNDYSISLGDIDSGPIILGYGTSATGLAIGAAKSVGDERTARKIGNTINLFSTEEKQKNIRHYKSYSPLSDAILLTCQTITEWDNRYIKK